jgi:glycosyltransferase involved in cell wall biosynthesis
MTLPIVSIVIPCYNAEAWVGEAIQSALDQKYSHREIIVIDDGSTDKSLDVIRSFGDAIRWETGRNRGGCAARNRGLGLAKGDFVQFLDADDRLVPDKLEAAFESFGALGGDVCVCRFRILQADGTVTFSGPKEAPSGDTFTWLLSSDVRICPLYRSSLVRSAGGFDSSLPCCHDFDLNLRIAISGGRYVLAQEIGYEIRRQVGSVSNDEIRLYRIMVQVLTAIAHQLDQESDEHEQRIMALAAKTSGCARWLLRLGDIQGGLDAFRAARDVHRSGGLRMAYSTPAMCLRVVLGPVVSERLLWRLRRLTNRGRRAVNRLSPSSR